MGRRFLNLVSKSIARGQEIDRKAEPLGIFFILIKNIYASLVNQPSKKVDFNRFIDVNSLQFSGDHSNANIEVDILFVATGKDFPILKFSIKGAIQSLSNYSVENLVVIVPSTQVQTCRKIVKEIDLRIEVISEDEIVDFELRQRLKKIFGPRYGWVLQQVLKLVFVSKSRTSGVLVVDADTVLISPRDWIDSEGNQILTPTWEYHLPYYEKLRDLDICDINPTYTFVAHHMLMQPSIVREILSKLEWDDVISIIDYLEKNQTSNSNSEFSIDYELYAQFLIRFYPEKVKLLKWSNSFQKGFSNETIDQIINVNKGKFASLSFHTYES